jgi:hypothetical protein
MESQMDHSRFIKKEFECYQRIYRLSPNLLSLKIRTVLHLLNDARYLNHFGPRFFEKHSPDKLRAVLTDCGLDENLINSWRQKNGHPIGRTIFDKISDIECSFAQKS